MSPVRSAARRLSWAAPTLVLLALVLALAACGDVAEVAPSPSTSLTSLLGYWRPVEVSEGVEVQLIRIAREGETYTIDAPPVYADRELTVAGERLELREEAGGETVYVAAFMLEPGAERLVQAHYFAAPFSGDPQVRTLYERAEGSADDLAEEIRQWWANTTAQEQIETLDHAVGLWSAEHGRYPLEEEMRPEGAFWQSPQAPEMVNAFTGAPLELGEGLGEFSYELTEDDEGRSRTISIHLYGGEDASATQWEAL